MHAKKNHVRRLGIAVIYCFVIYISICDETSILYFVFILDINQSIPMVAWNKNQECGLQTEHFILLLHKLGFHLATDVGKCFPRIPDHWPADHLYHLALKVILLLIYIVGSFDIFSIVHKYLEKFILSFNLNIF